ncbi:prolyl endopeptidase isoform X2 [Tetranychus urticae]|uniref:prolyl endopeptidase isoform X2 n=1 Tax=Tetranychus urticae TaxID=32264 RepID=UPI00077C0046|nr:prolyl endopeptidase isoform X2 [Tetranychus urticae]
MLSKSILRLIHVPKRQLILGLNPVTRSLSSTNKMVFNYPKARRDESVIETLHGIQVKDPYRWLEDPESEETKNFVHEQNKIFQAYIAKCDVKDKINERLKDLMDYPKYSCPFKRGSRYFFRKNDGLQNQSVLYIQDSLDSEPKVFFDPNTLDKDGLVSLSFTNFSLDGEWLSYGLADAGSDWRRIKIRKVDTGADADETVYFCKYSQTSWTHDNKGFFYSRYPKLADTFDGSENVKCVDHKMYYHKVGTPQENDVLVVEFPEYPEWVINGLVSDCGKYLFVFVAETCQNTALYYAHLDNDIKGKLELKPIVTKFEAEYDFIANDGTTVYFKTNRNAPNYKIIKLDLNDPDEKNWIEIIPEHEKNVLNSAICVDNDKLITIYTEDVIDAIQFRTLKDGNIIFKPKIPVGSIGTVTGKRYQSQVFFDLSNFLTPGMIFKYDFNGDSDISVFRETLCKGFDMSKFEVKQIFYSSKDGTKVPMFIVHSKDFEANGESPCLLYGYGGFNITLSPFFSPVRLLWVQNFRGVFAVANLRGGGEYGEKWHEAGVRDKKQNVFDDFIAAAEYLIDNKYTNKKKIVIEGGSNGGLLVAACSNQRPDLFGATICQVGVLDSLRFHKFGIGKLWTSDYGHPENENDFKALIKYSPLHNIPAASDVYPKILLLTGDHDDRVAPLHTLKFVAELQHSLNVKEIPLLTRVEVNAGHGASTPVSKQIAVRTDIYCFLKIALDLPYYE